MKCILQNYMYNIAFEFPIERSFSNSWMMNESQQEYALLHNHNNSYIPYSNYFVVFLKQSKA